MSPAHFRKSFLGVAALLILAVLACNLPTTLSNPAPIAGTPGSSLANARTNANALLPDPSAGLSGLQSYHAVFDQSLSGTLDGKPYQGTTHVEYSRAASQDQDLVRATSATGNPAVYLQSARIGGAYYSLAAQDAPCQGSLPDPNQAPITAPASNLLPVLQADKVGSETVNGIPATHYRFTQAGLPIVQQASPVSGEVWIANSGGFVVKYLLTSAVPAHPSGKGLEVGQTWDYELSQVNVIAQIALPAGCEPVPVGIPAMADAQGVELSSGQLTYTSPSALAAVFAFYNQKLPAAGWKYDGASKPKDNSNPTLLYFEKGQEVLTILMDSSSGTLQVTAALSNQPANGSAAPSATLAPGAAAQPAATLAPAGTAQPAATTNLSQSGLPSDVPLYPGAANIQTLFGMGVRFTTSDTPGTVSSFYDTHLSASGWNSVTSSPAAQIWQKNGKTLNVVVMSQNGQTSVLLTTAGSP